MGGIRNQVVWTFSWWSLLGLYPVLQVVLLIHIMWQRTRSRETKRGRVGPKRNSKERFLFKLCMYPYCSPYPARQPYPSHAQKYILERFSVKKKKKIVMMMMMKIGPWKEWRAVPGTSVGWGSCPYTWVLTILRHKRPRYFNFYETLSITVNTFSQMSRAVHSESLPCAKSISKAQLSLH